MTRNEIIAAHPIVEFVRSRGHELKQAGKNFVTNACPVASHKRGHMPVTIDPAKQLWHCNDCGVGGAVIDWLAREKGVSGILAMRELAGGSNDHKPRPKFVCAYDYTDERGKLLFQVCRTDPKDFFQRRPNGRGWINSTAGVRRVLYRLAEVIKAQTVIVVEGEKDADNVRALGFTATTNCSGGGKWRDEYSETLRGKDVVVFGDADAKGREHVEQVITSLSGKAGSIRRVVLPDGIHDVSDWIAVLPKDACANAIHKLIEGAPPIDQAAKREPRIRFFSPCLLRDFVPEKDIVLVGDCHIMRGEVFVIGGEPGVGKSLGATQLAVSGATQRDWFGHTVHRQFRTMTVQTENGRYRLRLEFSSLDCDEIENWIRVSEPPPFGLTLTNKEFRQDIGAALDSFKPECVIFDPWNAAAHDDKQRDYVETFDALRNLLPTGSDKPALGIIAHTRKPLPNEKRTGGTGLMHLLAGSYVLTSVPRCIFVMTRGSNDETDDSVVFFNPKNSNGENAPRSAWHRKLSGFTPATDFDWKEFDKPPEERKIIKLDHVREVFGDGEKRLELKDAAHDLATLVEVTESAAYNALKKDGKFSANLSHSNGMLTFHSTKFPRKSR